MRDHEERIRQAQYKRPVKRTIRELIEEARLDADLLADRIRPSIPFEAVPGFEVICEVGRGGMGVVYAAVQLSTKRVVALKVLLAGCFASVESRRRFRREVELAARLQHPGIVRVLESGHTESGQPYYAMDLVDGYPLDVWRVLGERKPAEIAILFRKICNAVGHAHEQGVVHRDLKPANVLIDDLGKPHVLDFGLAKAVDAAADELTCGGLVSTPGQVLGTLRYLSPEQTLTGTAEVDVRTDVYALGLLLYEALTEHLPFDCSGEALEVMDRIRNVAPLRPSEFVTSVNRDLETVVLKALEKDRTRRYQSAVEFAADLRRYAEGAPIIARRPSRLYVLRKRMSRHWVKLAVVALVAIVGLAGLKAGMSWNEHKGGWAGYRDSEDGQFSILRTLQNLEDGRTEAVEREACSDVRNGAYVAEALLVCARAAFQVAQERRDHKAAVDAIGIVENADDAGLAPYARCSLMEEMCRVVGIAPPAECEVIPDESALGADADEWYQLSIATLDEEKAIVRAQRAVDSDPHHFLASWRLAHLQLLQGDLDSALATAQPFVDRDDHAYWWRMFLGRVLTITRAGDEAIEQLTAAMEYDQSGVGRARRARGVAYLCNQQWNESIQDLLAVADARGADGIWERYICATPLWIMGELERAVEMYREVASVRGASSFAGARLYLIGEEQALALEISGDRDGADETHRKALIVLEKGFSHASAGDHMKTIFSILKGGLTAVEIDAAISNARTRAERCEICYYAGERYRLDGEIEKARSYFHQCVDTEVILDPGSASFDPMNEYHLSRWRLDQIGWS